MMSEQLAIAGEGKNSLIKLNGTVATRKTLKLLIIYEMF